VDLFIFKSSTWVETAINLRPNFSIQAILGRNRDQSSTQFQHSGDFGSKPQSILDPVSAFQRFWVETTTNLRPYFSIQAILGRNLNQSSTQFQHSGDFGSKPRLILDPISAFQRFWVETSINPRPNFSISAILGRNLNQSSTQFQHSGDFGSKQ